MSSMTFRQKSTSFSDTQIGKDGVIPYQTTDFLAIPKWLLDIPLDERVEETIQYVVTP